MDATEQRVAIRGNAWIAGPPSEDEGDPYWAENEPMEALVQSTDVNEVALHVIPRGSDESEADVSFYMTHQEAMRLMAALGQAVLR